ncbi:unnamed protein product [Rotaria sp. Silwood2]|nr:unnamed protein product [Rotaria sp. Silwood2]
MLLTVILFVLLPVGLIQGTPIVKESCEATVLPSENPCWSSVILSRSCESGTFDLGATSFKSCDKVGFMWSYPLHNLTVTIETPFTQKHQPYAINIDNTLIKDYSIRIYRIIDGHETEDSHSDQLIKLFDKTLSTVTPNRDNDENLPNQNRQRRIRPLPLCLSDNEKNMPVLTVITTEENSNNNKRLHNDDDNDENSENSRSIKRCKIIDETNKENHLIINRSSIIKYPRHGIGLIRSLTEPNEEQIKASVELGSNRDLIGDRSRTYLLSRCQSRKHPDLACINPETMIDVLKNIYASDIENLHIIDCRYPYEYEGGHIQSAKNLYTRKNIYNEFFRKPIELKDPTKRNIFIFHCEFSSERAPSLYFRSEDRNIHEKNYPELHYPEIYLLDGGYKALYEYSTEFCIPNQYRTMIDIDYQDEYRQYRYETKQCERFTGTNEKISGGRRTRVSTFRSCLSFSSQPIQYRSMNIRYDLRYTGSPPQS